MDIIQAFYEKKKKIGIIGLGYVGLPLAIILAQKFQVIGFDIDHDRVNELKDGEDKTNEVEKDKIINSRIEFTSNPEDLHQASLFIITVPTPIDDYKIPDLSLVKKATQLVSSYITQGNIIVYESTVYPGVTEEICVPILENGSHLKWKKDFFIGYSPERVNPGDKKHTIDLIKKIVSADTKETLNILSEIYGAVITAGIHEASTIKTAEAAKVIENIQRDLNIALMNELAIIFNKMGIDTKEVIQAAASKWNFKKFEPGLVGGHCIGVDPYYLTFKAESLGYHPQVILAGRRINDSMSKYVVENTIKLLVKSGKSVKNNKVLILGLTFKENTPDIRNTKIIDIYHELSDYDINCLVYDPIANPEQVVKEYQVNLIPSIEAHAPYDLILLAVKHDCFIRDYNFDFYQKISNGSKVILLDIKGIYDKNEIKEHDNLIYWRL